MIMYNCASVQVDVAPMAFPWTRERALSFPSLLHLQIVGKASNTCTGHTIWPLNNQTHIKSDTEISSLKWFYPPLVIYSNPSEHVLKTFQQNRFVLKYKAYFHLNIHVTTSSVVINKFHYMYYYKRFWKWKREYWQLPIRHPRRY